MVCSLRVPCNVPYVLGINYLVRLLYSKGYTHKKRTSYGGSTALERK
jgi:hypothetical protein